MAEFRTKMGENGRVVIPAFYRRYLNLKPGEELVVHLENEQLCFTSLKHSLKKAQDLVKKHAKNQSLVKKLLTARKEEANND